MVRISSISAWASLLFSPAFCAPFTPNAPVITRDVLAKRAEPQTGDDFPDIEPHPNALDKVEGAFNDAMLLAEFALEDLAKDDNTILKHYFNEGDKKILTSVFGTFFGPSSEPEAPVTGNEKLGNIFVQMKDAQNRCGDGRTLAYMEDHNTDKPFIVLCPRAFNKKAITDINGADRDNGGGHYIDCDDLAVNGHVSYLMNSLGATLLHEYLHYDDMFKPVVGSPIIDQPDGYGPVNVYNKLDKTLALTNADSYMYYALELLWTNQCNEINGFAAPRAGIDDDDPDCGNQACQS